MEDIKNLIDEMYEKLSELNDDMLSLIGRLKEANYPYKISTTESAVEELRDALNRDTADIEDYFNLKFFD